MSDSAQEAVFRLVQLYLEDRISPDQEDKLELLINNGSGVSADLVEEARAGAAKGRPLHQTLFGQMQWFGWGVAKNNEEAVRLFRLSHQRGCAKGTYWYSRCLLYGCVAPNREEGARLLHESHLAHPRDARVPCQLAFCYLYGEGVEQNSEEAARLLLEAARLGYSQAMFSAGSRFRFGQGVERDLVEAARWFRRAAALGQSDAHDRLEDIQREDAEAVVPYGEWEPRREVHRWVSDTVHREMVAALLVCKRMGTPRDFAVHHLLPYICTKR